MVNTDVLSSLLRLLHFRASVFFHSSYCGAWTIDTSGSGRSTFHLIVQGQCFLHLPEADQAVPLKTGDLLVFPRDATHQIVNSADPSPIDEQQSCELEQSTALICGYFDFDDPQRNPLIQSLPDHLLVQGDGENVEPHLQVLVDLMKAETETEGSGADVVVDKLSEILFIYAVRSYVQLENPESGMLAAMFDRHLGLALNALHNQPARSWTVEKLATVAGLSRSAFSKHFTSLMHQTPMHYLADWRMQLATRWLKEGQKSVLDISESVGYSNEAAFRKAYKQITGMNPGAVRKQMNR